MCEENKLINSNDSCFCYFDFEKRVLSKEELLMRLKEYKRNLELELLRVKSKLEPETAQEKGGE